MDLLNFKHETESEESIQANLTPIDELDARILKEGSWSSKLSWSDRLKLRAVVKKVHLKHFPDHLITDYECDRMIEAIAPQTAEYLIKKHIEGQR